MQTALIAAAPNWADQMTAITTLIAAAATVVTLGVVIASAIVAYRQFRASKTRQVAETVVGWTKEWTSEPLQGAKIAFSGSRPEAHRELAEKAFDWEREREDVERLLLIESVPNFFEGIALLTRLKAVPIELVERYWGEIIIDVWGHWESAAGFLRTREGLDSFAELQELAEKLLERREQEATRASSGRASGQAS